MAIEQGIGAPREFDDGSTAVQQANQFVTVRTAGTRDLVKRLRELAAAASLPDILRKAVRKASEPIFDGYQDRAKLHEATGNLAASVTRKYKDYPEGAVVIVGPRQTGPVGSTRDRRSGNHAWLVEFGTARRRPGTQGRRTYVNVHQMINRRMTKAGSFNNDQFASMGRGYYFLMGSIDEPSRQGGGKAGYSKDFMLGKDGKSGEQHPITLGPGDTIAEMKPMHLMQDTIMFNGSRCLQILRSALENEINRRGG